MPFIVIPVALVIGAALGAVGATALILKDHKDGPQNRYDKQREEQKK